MVNCYLHATCTSEYRTPWKKKKKETDPFSKARPGTSASKRGNDVINFCIFQRPVCTCVHALMCAFRTDGKIRPFDVSPDGSGQLVARGTELRPPESWGPNPGAASFPPPLSLSSPRSSDQYRLLITENSVLVLFSHLRFHFSFAWFSNLCHRSAIGSSY